MYEGYFGLQYKPFSLTPDVRQYVPLPNHEHCLKLLPNAIEQGDGFLLVTGEVGTGKTLLCTRLVEQLKRNEKWRVVWLTNPLLTKAGLLEAICKALALPTRGLDSSQLLDYLSAELVKIAESGQYLVLIIDEAQALATDTLEALRLLTNLESQTRKLAHVLLFAQPEIEQQLTQHQYRQIRQRIVWHHRLAKLTERETKYYLNKRMQRAGYLGDPIFHRQAIKMLWRQSRGIPRLLNLLADKSLLSMQAQGARALRKRHIKAAMSATTLHKAWQQRLWPWFAVAAAGIALGGALWIN
ncbi:ExeA family protein [Salinibius halmophilus]|uniref:ExeA family protein n=1 Tax=Salinibius halmophilus TaxID=1853216 RepID=UPI000E667B2D|nr:AAA family ATPase [Salinibius halmophilus]